MIRKFITKIFKYVKSNILNVATYIIMVVAIIAYIIRLYGELKIETPFKDILSMSADYVAICSCIIVLFQLIAYFNDSRHNEFRSRKEAALDIAKQYVDLLAQKISFIQNTLSIYYNEKDPNALSELVLNIDLSTERFIKSSLDSHKPLEDYSKVFINQEDAISLEILSTLSIMHNDILGIKELEKLTSEKQKHVANSKFKILVSNTMNTLEYFAMSVNQNVAESEMLFPSLHQTFLKFVHFMYPMICLFNTDDIELFYPNVIELYRNWNNKSSEINAEKQKSKDKTQSKIEKSYHTGRPL